MMTTIHPDDAHLNERTRQRFLTYSAVARDLAECASPNELFETAGHRLYEAGEICVILTLTPPTTLRTGYFFADELAPAARKRLHELTGSALDVVDMPPDGTDNLSLLLADGKTRLAKDGFTDFATAFPSAGRHREEINELLLDWNVIYAMIRVEGEPAGVLIAGADDLHEADIPTVELFARLLGSLWRGILRLEAKGRRREQLALINHIAQEINTAGPSLSQLAQSTVDTLANHPGYGRVRLALLERQTIYTGGNGKAPAPLLPGKLMAQVEGDSAPTCINDLSRSDLKGDPNIAPTAESLLAALLVDRSAGEEPQGVLWAESDWPDMFDEGDVAAFQAIAGAIATGMENVRAFKQVDHQLNLRVRQLRVQAELGQAVTGSLDHNQVLHDLLDWTTEALGTERSSLILIDEETRTMRIRYAIGSEQKALRDFEAPIAGSLTEWVYQRGEMACIPDPSAPGWYTPYMGVWNPDHMPRNILFMPLIRGEQVIGVLGMMNKAAGTFDDLDIELVRAISPWATIALENAQMYRESVAQAERFERAIEQVGRALAAGADLKDTLDTILALAMELIQADASALAEINVEENLRHYYAGLGLPSSVLPVDLPLAGSLGELAIRTGQVEQITDMLDDTRIPYNDWVTAAGVRSQAVAALRHGETPVGLLTVYRREVGPFKPEDRTILQTFADQAALAIERTRLMERRLDQAASLQAIMDTTSESIMALNAAGRVKYANRAAREMHLLCQPAPPDAQPLLTPLFLRMILPRIQEEEFGEIEVELTDIDTESPVQLAVRLSPLQTNANYLVLVADVTEERRQDQLRYEFLRNIYHELQTPLTAILGYLQLLDEEITLSEEERERCVRQAYAQAQRLRVLAEDLQAYSYLAESPAARPMASTDPKAALHTALKRVKSQYPETRFMIQMPQKLPQVALSERTLRRVLRHLLDNAAKFSKRGAVVDVRAGIEGQSLWIAVTDHGIGIAQSRLAEIFDPFHQLDDRTERRYQGVGLGLPLVRHIAESVGGRIEVESAPGAGSTFTLTLPTASMA